MALTKTKLATAVKTLREAIESGEFTNADTRSLTAAAAALEAYTENEE